MTRVVVIGVGSPFGADRLGWDLVSTLRERPDVQALVPEALGLVAADRPGTTLITMMKGAEVAIIVDAVRAGGEPGSLVRLGHGEIWDAPDQVSAHGLGVAGAIKLAIALGELPRRVEIIGLEIGQDPAWMPTAAQQGDLAEAVTAEIHAFIASQAIA